MRTICLTLMVLCASGSLVAQSSGQFVNFRIFPSGVTQTEPVVAIHPTNPFTMFASAVTINTNNGFKSEGVYVSTDGGAHWGGSDTCTGALIANHDGDPGVAIGANGVLVLNHIGSIFPGVYSHYSTDLGAHWSSAYTVTSQQPEDKGTTAMDISTTSPFFGRIYSAWVSFVLPYPVVLSYSSDTGRGWTAPSVVYSSQSARCSGGFVGAGAGGTVYVCWATVGSTSPFVEDSVGFAASTDGGASWYVDRMIFDMNGINGTLASKSNIRVNGLPHLAADRSGGVRDGWLYLVTTERDLAPAGSDPDIIVHRSPDGGRSWSAAIRVNQDGLNNGKVQYFPAIHVDSTGAVDILFYDDRSVGFDSSEVVLARSTDGGDTWNEFVISDHRFKPKPIAGGSTSYQGDHIALTSAGGKLHAFWMDDFSGIYQIWTCPMSLPTLTAVSVESEFPTRFVLGQNYPNPFNPNTNFRFGISDFGFVSLKVYDVLGREVETLANEYLHPGVFTRTWNGSKAASGVYFYRLISGAYSGTRSMVLVK